MEKSSSDVKVYVEPLPRWLPAARLLGTDAFESTEAPGGESRVRVVARLPRMDAADVAARLRGVGIDGRPIVCVVEPALTRNQVRDARLRDARARRETTPGFVDGRARATGAGRYSLTPEALALAMGRAAGGRSVVDACAGSGGNAIAFARTGSDVTAVEVDRDRVDELRHNARVHGVASTLRVVHGDALSLVPRMRADVLFVDPPWGESYDKRCTSISDFPLLDALLREDLSGYGELWMKLPASFDSATVAHDSVEAVFGEARGDYRRIKFLLLRREVATRAPSVTDRGT